MRTPLLAATLLLALCPAPGLRAQEAEARQAPTVQRTWRIGVLGLDVDPDLRIGPLLERCQRDLARELPGLDVRFDIAGYRAYRSPADAGADLDEAGAVRAALRLAEADGVAVADYDAVFVFTPHGRRYFGLSHVDYRDRAGRWARGAQITSRPAPLLFRGVTDALEGRHPPGFQPPAAERELPEWLRRLASLLLRALERPLGRLLEAPGVREALLAPTVAHELGHFFAPGDRDVKDGYQEPWLRHATGPDDNPEGHDVECCMYKGRSLEFYARKLLATRGRAVVFCDPCREKLGLATRGRVTGVGVWF